MTFWIIIAAILLLVIAMLARPILRPGVDAVASTVDFDLKVYRDQLSEVERDVSRGVLDPADAERARTEISRRILAADAAGAATGTDVSPAGTGPRTLAAAITVVILGCSVVLYAWIGQPGYGDLALQDRIAFAEELRETRPSQEEAVAGLPPFVPQDDLSDEFRNLMARLRETVAGRPDDLQGHQLLAQNEARIGNFAAAAEAQEDVLRLKGSEITVEDVADYGELLVMAAGGYVSPEAEKAFRAALSMDEDDALSRYYLGLMMIQTGRPDIAFRLWDALLRRGPEDAPWIAPILAQIEDAAQLAGVNYTLPEIGQTAARGPSAEDIENAADMTPEDRMAMIGSMVENLSNRLATEGGPPQEWARLITSLSVIGNPTQARAVYDDAMQVFAGNEGALDTIRAAGAQAGVAE